MPSDEGMSSHVLSWSAALSLGDAVGKAGVVAKRDDTFDLRSRNRSAHCKTNRAASRSCLATGPATVPPTPVVTSGDAFTKTAKATTGFSAGAKPMIQACDDSPPGSVGPRNCAVPVLAAAWIPFSNFMQQRAVPLFTTPIMKLFNVAAVSGDMAVFHSFGLALASTPPPESRVSSTNISKNQCNASTLNTL